MKLGDTRNSETIRQIASPEELLEGRLILKHPRCGRVVFEDRGPVWLVVEIEIPDDPPSAGAGTKTKQLTLP